MWKKGWLLLLLLLCVAFLMSCKKGEDGETERGELVRLETVGEIRQFFFSKCFLHRKNLDNVIVL